MILGVRIRKGRGCSFGVVDLILCSKSLLVNEIFVLR